MIHAFSVVDHNQRNVSVKQWSDGCLPTSKSQSVSGTSDQLSEGRKKRHLSETAVGKKNWYYFRQHYFFYNICSIDEFVISEL